MKSLLANTVSLRLHSVIAALIIGCVCDTDMDPEQRAQMESGVESVQAMLGPDSPITETQIRDALWNFYFDIEESVTFLLGAYRIISAE